MAALLATGVGPIFSGSATAQTPTEEQCSLAVVSRLAGNSQNVCETRVVQDLAKRGHAFEQNQLGIASMLAIGPDYTDKEALKWFEKAAQKGYAPAQVNLAVMYANGWGTPVNSGAALNWLHVAANQHFAALTPISAFSTCVGRRSSGLRRSIPLVSKGRRSQRLRRTN